jgi:CheY-like chemotaxis protein
MIVFYADDDPEDRELFSDALKEVRPETELILASHGKELLSILRRASVKPDFIFLDINMPVMGGRDCLAAIKETSSLKDIPVVMYTTTTNKRELEKFIALGAKHCLVKGASFHDIKESLASVLAS